MRAVLVWLFCVAGWTALESRAAEAGMHHLGEAGDPEWEEFRGVGTEGRNFKWHFTARKNTAEWTLFVRQRDVKVPWRLRLNGQNFTNLFLSEDDLVSAFAIPAGRLVEGTNTLETVAPKERDDIEIGDFRIDPRPLGEALREGSVRVRVREGTSPLPARLTIVDKNGSLFPAWVEARNAAVRPGVAYVGEGEATLHLPRGDYTVYAGRGFEYGVSTQRVTITGGAATGLEFELRREVSTPGWVACDTHVHTFTYSGHGDASAEERAITLAGEGIELPIATDHNVVIDLAAPARATGMDRFFTPVPGAEVTTSHAHFNVFPITPGSKAPNFRIADWPELMVELRGTPGVRVVILNHPRNVHNQFQPFAATNFNAETGENLRGPPFTFDAMEIVNSSAMQSDWMLTFRDWMAVLNNGPRVTGLGTSDGHDVSRYIIGQGRSYVAVEDRDPARIDVGRACESILRGQVLISMGLLAELTVNGKFTSGDLATNLTEIEATVTVRGPSWTAVDHVQLFANGELIREERFAPVHAAGEKKRLRWRIERSPRDAYLLAVASGPPVSAPYWRIPKPYQPTSREWKPRVVGAANPVWLDMDGDGQFTPLRRQKGR